MRARWVKPEFFNDKKIGKLGPTAAVVFEALWCMADDGGTALCPPELVKGTMFMYWPMIGMPEISESLERLAADERIRRYTVGDDEYAVIVNFKKHQPVHNPSLFRHPLPAQQLAGSKDDRLRQGYGSSSKNGGSPHIPKSSTPRHLHTYSPEFDALRALHPRRSGGDSKEEAFREYKARLRQGSTHEQMFAGTVRYKAYCEVTGKTGTEYVKQQKTFLGKGRHYLEPWDIPIQANNGNSAYRARAETLLVAFTRHGFTQNLPPESHERHIQELAAAGKILDPEHFKAELFAVKPWTWLGSTREADREKSISRIAAAIATVAA